MGRRQKSDPKRPNQSTESKFLSNTTTSMAKFARPEASPLACEIEARKPVKANDCTRSRTANSTSIGKKSSASSIFSRSSVVSAFNFCQTLMSPDLSRAPHEHSPSVQCSVAQPSRPALASLNSQSKSGEMLTYGGLNIREDGEQSDFSRPRSYSDDPFAPPTPRLPYSISHLTHGDSCSLKSSITSSYARSSEINDRFSNFTVIPQSPEPCLPNINRISKFDFGDWSSQWVNPTPRLPPLPVRQVSMSSSRLSLSPTLTCQPQHFRRNDSTQYTPSVQACYSSTSQIPFPNYSSN